MDVWRSDPRVVATQAPGQGEPRGDAQGPVPQGFSGDLCPAVGRPSRLCVLSKLGRLSPDRRHPVVRRTRQRCRAAKATQGGPLQAAHTCAVPRGAAKIWDRGELEGGGLSQLPMVPAFFRCALAAPGVGDLITAASLAPCAVGLPTCVRRGRRCLLSSPRKPWRRLLN